MKRLVVLLCLLVASSAGFGQDANMQQLEKELKELKQKVNEQEKKIEASADMIESKGKEKYSFMGNTTIGGYGELHINQLSGKDDATSSSRSIDFHRFVLFFEHKFTDKIKLFSELEVEHVLASSGAKGEVELEQAYIDFEYYNGHHLWAGLFLLPVGFLNETHEPNTFYGVERNPVEKNIIPTTWWEGGVLFKGQIIEHLTYDFALHSALNTDLSKKYSIRSGRQKVSEAEARSIGSTARVTYRPIAGLDLSLVLQYQNDITQKSEAESVSAFLFNLNASYEYKGFGIKALYAHWELGGDGPESIGANRQFGFYIEPSYRINDTWGVFGRWSQYDNTAGSNGGDSAKSQVNIGVNYWPHESVVVKLDLEDQYNQNDADERRGFNLGIGYQF